MANHLLRALTLMLLAVLAGCSSLGAFNAVVPKDAAAVVAARDVAYGDDPRQRLDVYRPADGIESRGMLVFVYGGSWSSGSKSDYGFVGKAFASRGFTTILFDYRLVPAVRYPGFVEDTAAAVAWAHRHAAEYGGDTKRLYLVGHSAGAYNAMMVVLAPQFLGAQSLSPTVLSAAVGISGPYDFLPLAVDATREAFAGVADLEATQPINHVRRGQAVPPLLLSTGDADETVLPKHTVRLAAKLRTAGHSVEEKHYPGVSHVGAVLGISRPLRGKAPILDDVVRFLSAH